MRDPIVRLLERARRFPVPYRRTGPGRHSAAHRAVRRTPSAETVRADPWRRPWTSPGKEQAQAILKARAEAARARRKLYIVPPGTYLPIPDGLLSR
ncbi:hypothetical protein AB0G74_11705 [Streptomyces sp. NPDC020875]|uniref:hypothetical protein n=1 Tax=Streptomyces sp. NPDC020875 TaxID=3154898 RepID=UPI0033FB0EFE